MMRAALRICTRRAFSTERKVLIFGSGFVSGPAVEFLTSQKYKVTVAGILKNELANVCGNNPLVTPKIVDVSDKNAIREQVSQHDITISLLPATWHPEIAKACIELKKNMVTASYISPAMRAFDEAAKRNDLTFLNEMGLDPGIDHMSAMNIINEVKQSGGKIESFESLCGGLPAPECADNPFGYKFSWSPRGVLTATQNNCLYRMNNKVMKVDAANLMRSAVPYFLNIAYRLELYPNRDSLSYGPIYGIDDAATLFRSTLRYQGYCALMHNFARLGFISQEKIFPSETTTWAALMGRVLNAPGANRQVLMKKMYDLLRADKIALHDETTVMQTVEAADWLGMFSAKETAAVGPTVKRDGNVCLLDIWCALLERKLVYQPDERDMCILAHKFGVVKANGKKEKITSTLIAYGGDGGKIGRNVGGGGAGGWSSMSRTVGLPVSIGAHLILEGQIASRGVMGPYKSEVYSPALRILKSQGIEFKEKVVSDE